LNTPYLHHAACSEILTLLHQSLQRWTAGNSAATGDKSSPIQKQTIKHVIESSRFLTTGPFAGQEKCSGPFRSLFSTLGSKKAWGRRDHSKGSSRAARRGVLARHEHWDWVPAANEVTQP